MMGAGGLVVVVPPSVSKCVESYVNNVQRSASVIRVRC